MRITGLRNRPELNGAHAVVQILPDDLGRITVLAQDRLLRLRAANVVYSDCDAAPTNAAKRIRRVQLG